MKNTGDRIFDLLKNEHFIQWVSNPTDESNHYWSTWVANNPDRKQEVEAARQFIQSSKLQSGVALTDEKYNMMLENIITHSRETKGAKFGVWRRVWKPLSAAASVVLVSMALVLSYKYVVNISEPATLAMIQKKAPIGRKITAKLPDGSVVTLNGGSEVTFPEAFSGDSRTIELSGEAFFEVKRNPEKPFFVKFNDDVVRVLGTSFNIRTYAEENTVSVAVATGKVSFTVDGSEVVLRPDEMAAYDRDDKELITKKVDRLEMFGWKEKILYFKNKSFDQITQELERWYGVDFQVTGDFARSGTYSGEFKNESLSEVLDGLSFIYRFDYEIKGKEIVLTKIMK